MKTADEWVPVVAGTMAIAQSKGNDDALVDAMAAAIRAIQQDALEAAAVACDSWDAGSHFDKMSDAIRALKPGSPPPRSP